MSVTNCYEAISQHNCFFVFLKALVKSAILGHSGAIINVMT